MKGRNLKFFIIAFSVTVIILGSALGGAIAERLFNLKPLDTIFGKKINSQGTQVTNQKILNEESVVIDVAENASPSVVTVSIQTPQRRVLQFNPFGGFSSQVEQGQPQDIGSGFIVSADGLIVTNKHVVSDQTSTYKVITKDNKEYEVKKISRDPANDIAILKIEATGLKPVTLGSSDNLKVGQFAIAIGTALGEFRHTVTTGVISGLGRGITAGSSFQGYVEKLDDVIQTDAAINPGNSGGPLLNSAGEVIGINVAVAQGAQNVGFAIPVNVVKDALNTYNKTGSFASKAYLGVEYQMITQQSAVLNNVPQGAYVVSVVGGSPAEKAGIKTDDIITKFDGAEVKGDTGLADIIKNRKPGQTVSIELWRGGQTVSVSATLSESNQ